MKGTISCTSISAPRPTKINWHGLVKRTDMKCRRRNASSANAPRRMESVDYQQQRRRQTCNSSHILSELITQMTRQESHCQPAPMVTNRTANPPAIIPLFDSRGVSSTRSQTKTLALLNVMKVMSKHCPIRFEKLMIK